MSLAMAISVAVIGAIVSPGVAYAAEADLVMNISTDSSVYRASSDQVYTVEITSRGPEDTTTPSTLTVNAPFLSTHNPDEVVCEAFGGAVCPTSYAAEGGVLSATVDSIPIRGKLVFTIPVNGTRFSGVHDVSATIEPGDGDTDPQSETNTSHTDIEVLDPNTQWSIDVEGPVGPTAGPQETYTLTASSLGKDPTTPVADITIADLQGSGDSSNRPYLDGMKIASIECTGATGGATCADVGAAYYDSATYTLKADFDDLMRDAQDERQRLILANMPSQSTLTIEVTVDVGEPMCTVGRDANRELRFSGRLYREYSVRDYLNPYESVNSPADNSDAVTTQVSSNACAEGDLRVTSLTQPDAQRTGGLDEASAFTYSAEYANVNQDDAEDARIYFATSWPQVKGVEGNMVIENITCVASGGAVCPADGDWTITGPTATVFADIPEGGSLSVTYTGTTGGGTDEVCMPQRVRTSTNIKPSKDFRDTRYDPDDLPNYINNRRTLGTQANIGSPCDESHDDGVTLDGPYTDPDATIPLTGVAQPGQSLYFRTTMTNADDPGSTKWDLDSYYHSVWFNDTRNSSNGWPFGSTRSLEYSFTSGGDPFSREDRWRVSADPNDPAGLPYKTSNDNQYPHDTGVRCVNATGGAVCPSSAGRGRSSGGGNIDGQDVRATNGWNVRHNMDGPPEHFPEAGDLPNNSSLEFISTYRVPPYETLVGPGFCSPYVTEDFTFDIPVEAVVEGETIPVTVERSGLANIAETLFSVEVKACTDTLELAKEIVTPETDGNPKADLMPADGKVTYKITLTNPSVKDLDLPRLTESPSGTSISVELTCIGDPDGNGAQCPDAIPEPGLRHFANGDTEPFPYEAPHYYDFAWGEPGQPTMPAGSSLVFEMQVDYDPDAANGITSQNNVAQFGADPETTTGVWGRAYDRVSLSVPRGASLGMLKSVNPSEADPGDTVTFEVDLVNHGDGEATDVFFRDDMHPSLTEANPDGFAFVSCRPLEASDNVIDPDEIQAIDCDSFEDNLVSTSAGLRSQIDSMPGHSGLRLVYTALAPQDPASATNIAKLTNEELTPSSGDASAKVNLSVLSVSISGTVWNDQDASAGGTFNNIQNGSEPGVDPAATAVLVDEVTGEVIATTPINPDGTYEFTGVPTGIDVTVMITANDSAPAVGDVAGDPVLPEGWANTTPLVQNTFNSGLRDTTNKDFGVVKPASVGDTVWLDADRDGRQDVDEMGVEGVPVFLLDEDGKVIAKTTTDADGKYLFEDLLPGNYQVQIEAPKDYSLTKRKAGSDSEVDSNFYSTGKSNIFTLRPAQDRRDIDAGLVEKLGSIGDYTWIDTDGDGNQDPGEKPLGGVKVTLLDADGNKIATTRTNKQGKYLFEDLPAGEYTVVFGDVRGYRSTTSVAQLSTLGIGGQDLDRDAGFVPQSFGNLPPAGDGGTPTLPDTGAPATGWSLVGGGVTVVVGWMMILAGRRRRNAQNTLPADLSNL